MPTYNWECAPCERGEEAFVENWRSEHLCGGCSQPMEKVWAITPRFAANGFPYTTKNFNGEPIEVSSPSHLKALCEQFGVTHRDDAAWIEKEYLGYDLSLIHI